MVARKIGSYFTTLGATADQQGLFAQAKQLALLQQIFVEIAPPQLARYCTVGWFSEGSLTLYSNNGTIAAKLKQISPSLLSKFRQKGYEVTVIRIAVQDNNHIDKEGNKTDKTLNIGPVGLENLRQLVAELSSSPLKSAIESLLEKQTKLTPPQRQNT